jgi:hypothetical protein
MPERSIGRPRADWLAIIRDIRLVLRGRGGAGQAVPPEDIAVIAASLHAIMGAHRIVRLESVAPDPDRRRTRWTK